MPDAFLPPTAPAAPAHKKRLSRSQRLLRLILSTLDPRAWAHMVKVVNYYNYSHVTPMRTFARQIGGGAEISPNVSFSNPENIRAGRGLHLGTGCCLWAGPSARGRIVIGDDVAIGPRVFMTAANYRFDDGAPVRSNAMNESEIVIGDDVWLGAGAIVLAGTRIGGGAIVGAGALVRGEVPPYAILAGNPARVIGHRRRPGSVASAPTFAPGEADPAVLALIRAETGFDEARLRLPVDASGIDSFDLITLRTFLEERQGRSVPDTEWAGIATLEDIARLPALREGGTPAAAAPATGTESGAGFQAEAPAAPPPAVPAASPPGPMAAGSMTASSVTAGAPAGSLPFASLPAPGRSLRRQAINMPQMALTGLGEAWLFKEIGDIHWAMITDFLKTSSAAIADDQGDRLYATFTRITLEVEPALRGFRENDILEIESRLERQGAGFFFGNHALSAAGNATARGTARTMSTFAKYGERGKNTSLMKGTPTLPDPEAIPSLPALPEFAIEYRNSRSAEPEGNLQECDYEILPPHDINGVGLLYFAAYPSVFDLCLERVEGKGFLLGHSTVAKDMLYFANSEPTEMLRFRLHDRREEGGLIHHVASLYRTSDGKRMAEVRSVKRPVA